MTINTVLENCNIDPISFLLQISIFKYVFCGSNFLSCSTIKARIIFHFIQFKFTLACVEE